MTGLQPQNDPRVHLSVCDFTKAVKGLLSVVVCRIGLLLGLSYQVGKKSKFFVVPVLPDISLQLVVLLLPELSQEAEGILCALQAPTTRESIKMIAVG